MDCDLCGYHANVLFHFHYIWDGELDEGVTNFDHGEYCERCFNQIEDHYIGLGISLTDYIRSSWEYAESLDF